MEQDLLERILDISHRMAETRGLVPLLRYTIDEAIRLVGAERGYVVLVRPDGSLDFHVQRDKNGQSLDDAEDQISRSVLNQVIKSGQPLVLEDAAQDPRFGEAESVLILGLRFIMCVPLISQGNTTGAIYVENRTIRGRFSKDDVVPLVLLANQAAVAIENARLFQTLKEAHQELEIRVEERTTELSKANSLLEQEISERKGAEDALRDSENMLTSLLQVLPVGVCLTDEEGRYTLVNDAYCENYDFTKDEIIGQHFAAIMPPDQLETAEAHYAQLLGGDMGIPVERKRQRKDGTIVYIEAANALLVHKDGRRSVITTVRDITERKRLEKRLEHLATHDPLTGLPNRILFNERLHQAISMAKRYKWCIAVMFLDLDNFKVVNDTFGHETGDELLQAAAKQMKDSLRESDTVARFGGDEFVFILLNISNAQNAIVIAQKILENLHTLFNRVMEQIDGISASIGISIYPQDGDDPKLLLKRADEAMYRVKLGDKGTYEFFSEESV